MSRQIQIRRGTSAEHENFTGAVGEITMDLTAKTLRVHDGETVGGTEIINNTANQTITGTKTFTNGLVCKLAYDASITPSTDIYPSCLLIQDSNKVGIAAFNTFKDTHGYTWARMYAHATSGIGGYPSIQVGIDETGNTQTSAPACDTINSIVTTTGITKDANGYVKLGNGIIFQWGSGSRSLSGEVTINLSIPFSTTKYKVFCQGSFGTGAPNGYYVKYSTGSKTKSSFGVYCENSTSFDWIAIGY